MKINNISRKNTCLLNALRLGQAFIISGKDTIYIKIADKDNRNMIKCDSIYEAGLKYPAGGEKGLHYAADTEVVPIELVNIDYKELSF